MKTKYKILITSILVLSMLTAFAVTSFAAYTTTDITYDDKTYTFNEFYDIDYSYIQLWGYESIIIYNQYYTLNIHDSPYIIIKTTGGDFVSIDFYYYYNDTQSSYHYSDVLSSFNIIYTGDLKLGYSSSAVFNENLSNVYVMPNNSQYDVFQNDDLREYNGTVQINLLNNSQGPLEKVNDFLEYLSTSLTKLTTMIITNQILILFIVAVPVVSFVIGSFKRIKDAGRA